MCMKLSEKQWECRAKFGVQIYIIRKRQKKKKKLHVEKGKF